MGSRLDAWCFLLDFFFVAPVVVVVAAEFAGADALLDCCGLRAEVATLTGCADAEDADASNARTSDCCAGKLSHFSPLSSLLGCAGLLGSKLAAPVHPYHRDFPRGLKARTSGCGAFEQPARNKVGCRRARGVAWATDSPTSGRPIFSGVDILPGRDSIRVICLPKMRENASNCCRAPCIC